jgi:isopenicillin-N N-acyltransferase-like protein
MQRTRFVTGLVVLVAHAFVLSAPAAELFRYPEGKHRAGELRHFNGLPVLIVQGTPEEIGEQTATLTADSVRPLAELPRKILRDHGIGVAWPLVAGIAEQMLKNVPADHREELEAGLRLSKVERDVLVVGNCLLELRRLGGCATLYVDAGKSQTKGPLLGRNFDLPPMGVLDKYSLVAVVRPKGKRPFVSVGYPGMVGVVSGMNDAGLTIATLDVYSSKDGSAMFDPRGTPLTFCYRRLLEECATVEEAAKLMRSMRRTTWMNLAVCDRKEGVVFEITPKNVAVRRTETGVLPCTNHFNSPELGTRVGCWRYAVLQGFLRRESFSVRDVGAAMHAVNQGNWTLQTMVFEPSALKLHLAIGPGPGPASARELKELELRPLLEAKPAK